MSTTMDRVERLKKYVDQMQCVADIIPLLTEIFDVNFVDVPVLQTLCKQQIDLMDTETIRSVYHRTMPLESIVPKDIIQHTLSFSQDCNNHIISKLFKECHAKNEAIRERERLSIVKESDDDCYPKWAHHASTSQTFVVRRDNPLSEEEMEKGCMLTDDFIDAFSRCLPGDTIYVEGQYEYIGDLQIQANIQIIGIGTETNLKFDKIFVTIAGGTRDLYFRNIQVESMFFSVASGKLWMDRCSVTRNILVGRDASSYLNHCDFNGAGRPINISSVLIDSFAHFARIVGCVFRNHRTAENSIEIYHDSERQNSNRSNKVMLACVGNIFKNNRGNSIADPEKALDEKFVILRANLLVGANVVDNANVVHSVK